MSSLGKNRRGGEGNTETSPPPQTLTKKQPNRVSFYCFTAFPKDDDDIFRLNSRLESISKKFFYGRELCPTTSKLHLQGFLHLRKPMRITELKLPCNPHLEATKGSEEQNISYCSKDGNVYKWGYPKPIEIIETLRPWQKSIEDILLTKPDPRKIHWYWESTGNIGKSSFVKYCVVRHKALFCDGGKKADIVNLVFNNDMDQCNTIIWDIPRCNLGSVSYSAIEAIKNGLVCNTKYETGVKVFNSPHIIIFANSPPSEPESLSQDRWIITELNILENEVLVKNATL